MKGPVMRHVTCLAVLFTATAAAAPPTAADPPPAEELAKIIKTLVTTAVPTPLHQQEFDWGRQHKVPNGITWEKSGIFLKPVKQEKMKNEGMWRRLKVEAVDPEKNLTVQVANVKSPSKGKLTFDVVVALPTRIKFEQQFWKSGVRIYSGETRARVRPILALKCESVSKVHKTEAVLPDVTFRLRVLDAKLSYNDFKVEHTAGVGGEMAEMLGNAAHDTIKLIRPNLEKDMLAKANKAVIKAGDTKEIKLGLGKLLEGK
jgi:hypothetical protein